VERGMASLSLERLVDLCDILDTSLDYLIRGNAGDVNAKIPPSLIEIFSRSNERELSILKEYWNLYLKIKSNDK